MKLPELCALEYFKVHSVLDLSCSIKIKIKRLFSVLILSFDCTFRFQNYATSDGWEILGEAREQVGWLAG